MSQFNKSFLTEKGADLLAKVEAGATLTYTEFAIGAGIWPGGLDDPEMTELVDERIRVDIQSVAALGDGMINISALVSYADLHATIGFNGKEIGIFATDPDVGDILYCAAYAGDFGDYIPSQAEASDYDHVFNLAVAIGNATTVTVQVDPALLATEQDLADHEAKQLDPADTDTVKEKHLSNAQGKAWTDDITSVTGDLSTHEAKELDPADTNTDKEKHLSNAQGKVWQDHIGEEEPHDLFHLKNTIGIPLVRVWQSESAAAANDWRSVRWSPKLKLFAAVATSGTLNRVMTSPDGITWDAQTTGAEENNWTSICWSPEVDNGEGGNGLFVAVANSGTYRAMTSHNGIDWTLQTDATAANSWRGICWSPGLNLFVAVAYDGGSRVMTSPNGIDWTTTAVGVAANEWYFVCWSPELSLFVAVANSGTYRVMTSSNGTTWNNTVTGVPTNSWYGVCWSPEVDNGEGGNGLFVAVSIDGTDRVMTSHNGTTWTSESAAEASDWYFVCWSPELSLFVAVAGSGTGNRVMTSPDSIIWTSRSSAEDNPWHSVCWSPELTLFVAVTSSGTNRVMRSL